jgi:TetR/AcrR family fatty acid metabolism transcriptional regulator
MADPAVISLDQKVRSGRTKAAVVADFRRRQILQAARATFHRQGLASATISDIARTARVAKGTVYLYFPSKDQILRQLLADALDELYRETVPPLAAHASLEDKVRHFLGTTLDFFDRNHDFFERCQFDLTPDVRRKARQTVGRIFRSQRRAWRAALIEARRGRARPAALDPASAASGIVSFAYGLGQQRLRGWVDEPRDRTLEWASAFLLEGLTPNN